MSSRGRNLPTCNTVITCIGGVAPWHRWKGDKNLSEVSTFIKDGSVCDFHKRTQNWAYASVWECMSSRGRNLPTCNTVITCIGGVAPWHRWKGDKNLSEVSTFIKDGSVCDFHKRTQNWAYASVWECMSSRGRNLPTCNTVITCIGGVAPWHRWKGDKNLSEVSTFIKDGSVCDFHKRTQKWAYASVWGCMSSRGRNLPTCNTVITCIGGVAPWHRWKGDKNLS